MGKERPARPVAYPSPSLPWVVNFKGGEEERRKFEKTKKKGKVRVIPLLLLFSLERLFFGPCKVLETESGPE